ncbi:MAG: hypothetical protein R3E32_16230 [Chitinophagales bacterium]
MSKPDINVIKIKCKPKGQILITVIGKEPNPQNFTTKITLSVFANEPNCTNNPVEALWNVSSGAYIGTGTFDGELVPDSHGYNADVDFFLNGSSTGTDRNIPVEVEAEAVV